MEPNLIFSQVQDIALEIDPSLTGDQLDRIGNIVCDQARTLDEVSGLMIIKAMCRVKHNVMEK